MKFRHRTWLIALIPLLSSGQTPATEQARVEKNHVYGMFIGAQNPPDYMGESTRWFDQYLRQPVVQQLTSPKR